MEPCKFGESCWRPLCCYGHPRKQRQSASHGETVAVLARGRVGGWNQKGKKETLETKVVSHGVEGVTRFPDGEGRRERVRQLTAEQIGDAPQFQEETVDEKLPVPCERVGQGTAEQIGDGHQLLDETVSGGDAGPVWTCATVDCRAN